MCKFKSGIILKNKSIICEGENDSHSDLLEKLGIEDDYLNSSKTFVRAELIPKKSKWWKPVDEWEFNIDQDIVPDWFEIDREKYEKEFREAVSKWVSEHIKIGEEIEELNEGYYLLKNCNVNTLKENVIIGRMLDTTVKFMYNNSNVNVMCENSTIEIMRDNSKIKYICGNSIIKEMRDNSTVEYMCDNSIVEYMCDNSTVEYMCDTIIKKMYKNSIIKEMCDNSTVKEMWDKSTVEYMCDNSIVEYMCDNSTVEYMCDNSIIKKMYKNSIIKEMCDNSIAINNSTGKILISEECNYEIEYIKKQDVV